jgi:hypothetical protein
MGCNNSNVEDVDPYGKEDKFNPDLLRTRTAALDAHPVEKWFERNPDYQYTDELDKYEETKGVRTLRKLAPSAAAEQFFWRIPLMGKSWDMYKAHVPATAFLLLAFAVWIGVHAIPYMYDTLQEPYPGGAKFCYGAIGLERNESGTEVSYKVVPAGTIEVFVDDTNNRMCAVTNADASATIAEVGSSLTLHYDDVHDIINTAWIPSVTDEGLDITGYFFQGDKLPASGGTETNKLITQQDNFKWAWSNRLFYFGLPSEWYLLFTGGLLSPRVQCYYLNIKPTNECPAVTSTQSVNGTIRVVDRTGTATTTTDETTETWSVGFTGEKGYIANEVGDGSEDWPQQLKRSTSGNVYVRDYNWKKDVLIALAFALPIVMAVLGAFAITTGTIVSIRHWLKLKRQNARGKFKQVMEYGSVALGNEGNFIVRIIKDDGPGKSAGPKAKQYANTITRFLKAWGCTPPNQFMSADEVERDAVMSKSSSAVSPISRVSPSSKDGGKTIAAGPEDPEDPEEHEELQFLTRDMEEVLHDFYVVDPFNNVVGIRSIVHLRDWEDKYRDDKRMWLLTHMPHGADCKPLEKGIEGKVSTTKEVEALRGRRLTDDQAREVVNMAKKNNLEARRLISRRMQRYEQARKDDPNAPEMDAWLNDVNVDKPIPSRFDMVRAFNDVPFLCCPISARESALVRAVRMQQADSSTPDDEDLTDLINADEIITEHTAEELDEIADLSRQGCCQGSGTTWFITKQRDGFDSNPTCAYGPMLFIEFLSSKLIEFFFSFLIVSDTNTPVFLSALPKLRKELVKAAEDPKLTSEMKADYQVMKVKQLLQTTEDPVLRRKTVKAVINMTHTAKMANGRDNPRAHEKVLVDFPSSHYLLDGQAVPHCVKNRPLSADEIKAGDRAIQAAKKASDLWWQEQLVERDQWRAAKKLEGCCVGKDEINGPERCKPSRGLYDNYDWGQPAWTPEERQNVIDRRIARLKMSPVFYDEKEFPNGPPRNETVGRPALGPNKQLLDGGKLYLNQKCEKIVPFDPKKFDPKKPTQDNPLVGGITKEKYLGVGQKLHESAYLASKDIYTPHAEFLDPAAPGSIDGFSALLKKSAVQRLRDYVEFPGGRGFMPEMQHFFSETLLKGWTTREFLSVCMMCLLMIGSCAVWFIGVIAMAMWDHDDDFGWYYAEIVVVPGYILAIVALHELHAYYHHGMEFFLFRKIMRYTLQILLAVNCWLTVWYVIVTALWMILGCIVNPDEMSPYGMATGAFAGVATSAYATFQEKKEEITKMVMDFVDEYLKNGINLPITQAANRALKGLPPFPEAVHCFVAEATSMIQEATAEKGAAESEMKDLTDLQDYLVKQTGVQKINLTDLTAEAFKQITGKEQRFREIAARHSIEDVPNFMCVLAKKTDFFLELVRSLDQISMAQADCQDLSKCLESDPSMPEPGTEILQKLRKTIQQGQELRKEGAEATSQISDNITQKQNELEAQAHAAEDKAKATIRAAQDKLDEQLAEAKGRFNDYKKNQEKRAAHYQTATYDNVDQMKAEYEKQFEDIKKKAQEMAKETKQQLENAKKTACGQCC